MNIRAKGSSCSSPANPSAAKLGKVFTYSLILVGSLVGNFFIGIIVYKTQTMRKPINYFIANMATSDLLYPIFQIPWNLRELYADSWPMSGPSDVAWCKLVPFLADVSTVVSIQSLVLIAVDRFGAVVFPLRSPLISSKRCPFFIFTTWIVAIAICSSYLFAFKLVEHSGQMACKRKWNEAFGEYFSDAIYFLTLFVVFFYLPMAVLNHTILHHPYQAQDTDLSRRAIGERRATTREKKQKGTKDGHRYRGSFRIVLGSLQHYGLTKSLCMGPWAVSSLCHPSLLAYSLTYGHCELCCQSLHLLHFQYKLSARS